MKKIAAFLPLVCLAAPLFGQTLTNYQTVISNQAPAVWFKLDGGLVDAISPTQSLSGIGTFFFSTDAGRTPSNSAAFLAQADALTFPNYDLIPGGNPAGTNDSATNVGSISLLFRSLDSVATGQRYIFGQGSGTTTNGNALGLFFENNTTTNLPGDLKLRVGNTTVSILASNAVIPDMWYHFVMTYDETRNSGEVLWYLGRAGDVETNGVLDLGDDAVVGDDGTLAIGNQADLSSGFRNPGEGRVDEFAIWNRELSALEVSNQFATLPNYLVTNAAYNALILAQVPSHFYQLSNSVGDAVPGGPALAINGTNGGFTTNILGVASNAYSFSGTNDALIVTSDLVNGGGSGSTPGARGVGTLSLLFRYLDGPTNTGQRFIFAQGTGSSGNKNQLSLFLENTNAANGDPNSLKLRVGNGPTTTIVQAADLLPNAWYYFAMAYDEARDSQSGGEVRYYIGPVGGMLATGAVNIANDAIIGDNGTFYFGNNAGLTGGLRSPGSGAVDDVATFNDELSPAEIFAQFAAVTNVIVVTPPPPPPLLSIVLAGDSVAVSWPTNTSPGFVLERNPDLNTTNWTTAGTPFISETNYVVTNSIAVGPYFYRLKQQTVFND